MNRLSLEKRNTIINALIEGMSMRATARMVGVDFGTVSKLIEEVGESCLQYQSSHIHGLTCDDVQADEIHSFVGCHGHNQNKAKEQHVGDVYTYTAIDSESKLIIHWDIGNRDEDSAVFFVSELSRRIDCRFQLNTDGLPAYMAAVRSNDVEGEIDHARLVKVYGKDEKGNEIVIRCDKKVGYGTPDLEKLSTSYVERQNLSMRMGMRRFTRRSNGHSRDLDFHVWMQAIYFQHYNFVRRHQAVKTAPAVAAGLIEKPWNVKDLLKISDGYVAAEKRREADRKFAEAFAKSEFA